jgi:hypothetical protein
LVGFFYFYEMELNFENLSLTIESKSNVVPNLRDNDLFLVVKDEIIELLKNPFTEIIDFGLAPDNDADGQEELLNNGTFFRLIAPDRYLGIDDDAEPKEIFKSFLYLLENYKPFWCSVFIEEIGKTCQNTIEIMYRDI